MKKKLKKDKFVGFSVRVSPIQARQLEELIKAYGENRSRTICRAIAIAHDKLQK